MVHPRAGKEVVVFEVKGRVGRLGSKALTEIRREKHSRIVGRSEGDAPRE